MITLSRTQKLFEPALSTFKEVTYTIEVPQDDDLNLDDYLKVGWVVVENPGS